MPRNIQSIFEFLELKLTPSAGMSLADRLSIIRQATEGEIVFTTSFSKEDQSITDAIFANGFDIAVVTLDTGRLFEETYSLWADTEKQYGRKISGLFPNTEAVQNLVKKDGANGFYDTVTKRLNCCNVRKVHPLNNRLKDADIWITGLRAQQSVGRQNLDIVIQDKTKNLVKVNPIIDWDTGRLDSYLKEQNVPQNTLHSQGYPSIGCAPCTRAVKDGEDERAGRWWWESKDDSDNEECGLHIGPDGKLVRTPKGGV